MHIQADRALIPAHTSSVRYLQVVISAPPAAAAAAPRAPVDVALVLDRSGSMGGSKIAMARTAVDHAIRLLKPQDHLAVICYDDQVDTVLARTHATTAAKALAMSRLAQIDARGSTNLSGGWLTGAAELHTAPGGANEPAVKRVLLLTDGLVNQGVVDHQELAATAAGMRTEGVTTSTFGVGADFDEELLARLAAQGGGHFYFIEQARQIPDFFASELGEALEVTARDVVFELIFGPGPDVALVNDLPVDHVVGGLRVRLGDLTADQEVTLLVAVAVNAPPPVDTVVSVSCRLTDRDAVFHRQPMTVDWRVASPAENDAQPVSAAVVLAAATLLAERARAQALVANRRGAFDEARRILADTVRMLSAMAPGDEAVAAVIAQLRHDEAEFAEAMSPLAMKRAHFASYSISESREAGGRAKKRKQAS